MEIKAMRSSPMKTLIIELQYPDKISLKDIKDYAKSALENWGGQFDPENSPLFYTTIAFKSRMHPRAKR